MKENDALFAFLAVLITIIALELIAMWTGKDHSEAVVTGLIGLAGGFTLGRGSRGP